MPRWANKRDFGDLAIFNALLDAHRAPIRGRDADIYCSHVEGHGLLLEVKSRTGRLRPIQVELQAMFKDRYKVVRSVSEALRAVGAIA